LKYFVGTATASDLTTLNDKMDVAGQKQGKLVHGVQNQMTPCKHGMIILKSRRIGLLFQVVKQHTQESGQ
jgi:hypothetical protein